MLKFWVQFQDILIFTALPWSDESLSAEELSSSTTFPLWLPWTFAFCWLISEDPCEKVMDPFLCPPRTVPAQLSWGTLSTLAAEERAKQTLTSRKKKTASAQPKPWLAVFTCITLSPRLPPGFSFDWILVPEAILGVGVTKGNFLVPGACSWEILFNLGLLFELCYITSQLGAQHAVKTAFSAAFYLLQQRQMRDWESGLQQLQSLLSVRGRGPSFALTNHRGINWQSPSERRH